MRCPARTSASGPAPRWSASTCAKRSPGTPLSVIAGVTVTPAPFRLGRAGVVDVLDVELLARCVGVIAAGGDGGPGDSIALRGERARAVDHRGGSAKRGNQDVVVG